MVLSDFLKPLGKFSLAKIRGGDETSSSGMRMTKTINAINANRLIMKLSTRSIHNPNNFTCFRQIVAHPGGVTRAFARRYLINWKFFGQDCAYEPKIRQ